MRVTAEHVKQTLRSQPIDTLSAEDVSTGERVGHYTGSADALCTGVDELEASMLVPYRLKAWHSSINSKRGGRSVEEKPFVWILQGRAGTMQQAAPTAPQPAPVAQNVNVDLAERAARNEAEVEHLRRELERARQELNEAKAALDEAEDEADTLSEAITPPAPLKWYESEAGMRAILETIKPISEAAGMALRMKIAPPSSPSMGTTPNSSDAELLVAWKAYEAVDPENAKTYRAALMEHFAPKTTAPNETAER